MAQDIMRRILRDYFGYEVQFVMNITDVDDKVRAPKLQIIKSSRADLPLPDHPSRSPIPSFEELHRRCDFLCHSPLSHFPRRGSGRLGRLRLQDNEGLARRPPYFGRLRCRQARLGGGPHQRKGHQVG